MIERDGINVSLWQNVPDYIPQQKSHSSSYDVAIIGGGITGVTTAWKLQREGKKCILLEAHSLCFGTTSGTTAHLNTYLDTPYTTIIKNFGIDDARLVAQSAADAIAFIKNTIHQLGVECGFEDASAFLFSQEEKQTKELNDFYAASQRVGLEVEMVNHNPVPISYDQVMKVGGQAKFHPTQYVHALAADYERMGGIIVHHFQASRVDEKADHFEIESVNQLQVYRAADVVYATHTPPHLQLLHLKMAPWRSYALAVKLKDNAYPEHLTYDMYDPYHYYRTQVVNGEPFLIAGGEDHKTAHEENTEAPFLKLESHLRKYFNVESIAYHWSSQYFESVDGLPYVGHLPGSGKRIYVATGYSGNGMIFGTLAAQIISDAIVGRKNKYQDLYSAQRIKPIAAFTDFIKNNADVAVQFVDKWISTEQLGELADLARGEGKVITYHDQLIALSKDEKGNLHAVSPTCTHMKCNVAWNLSEQSWDCPCHGARYSPDGKVITGPATKDLQAVAVKGLA